MNWLIDHLPWWLWVIIGGSALAATAPFWTTIWAVLPRPIKFALAGAAAIATAYFAGRNRGAKNAADRQAKRDAEAVKTRLEVEDETRRMPAADRDRELRKWMRD